MHPATEQNEADIDERIAGLLGRMTLAEKIGQMSQINGAAGSIPEQLRDAIAAGRVGSIINEVDPATVNELQRIALRESRLGIPLLIGRDVIHGFNTIFPIPLGQAATWNPGLVKDAAAIAAHEATACGINWALAPMLDIGRDPRWGRIAETFGEDPYLISVLGTAMTAGYQGDDLAQPGAIAACAKHYAGYGATEAGRDYNTTNIPENELRNVHLPPFEAAANAGIATFMAGFSDLNGIPCTGNGFLMNQVLRDEWAFDGFVVSDWESVTQLATHGFTADDRESAERAVNAGLDMEMASTSFIDQLELLIADGKVSEHTIDTAVSRILHIKFALGLFDDTGAHARQQATESDALALAHQAARESIVLLKNDNGVLPLSAENIRSVAVIGPLADAPQEQLGTWVFDGDPTLSQTPLQAIQQLADRGVEVHFAQGVATTRSHTEDGFAAAVAAAAKADVAVLFIGEEAILSGEAHCRADITLPGNQAALVNAVAATSTPVVLVVMAGRPLVLENVLNKATAIFYAWHPGTMAGPAIADLLFGNESPSGKLPVTLPKAVGQVPIYYAQKNTGRPGIPDSPINIDSISEFGQFESAGFTSFHLDTGCTPRFGFGYGLSYTRFSYSDIQVSTHTVALGDTFEISADLTNEGDREADEIVQLYIRDLVGSVTRPVRELKGFRRVRLSPGERRRISFQLHTDDLAFYGADMQRRTETGAFRAWIGGNSAAEQGIDFTVTA
ncbi:MAG: glycoside hydrolase family 3 C-terminal domain-containing protein [Gammaproteobacteria bacterium]|nr:glycoside hydrolase family 3 C-terminal domain-containing protein [Gammaproteobacteria bacterium]